MRGLLALTLLVVGAAVPPLAWLYLAPIGWPLAVLIVTASLGFAVAALVAIGDFTDIG